MGTLDLQGIKLVLGLTGSFLLGAIMPLGIGYYAPCMILVNLLGMNPLAAFPIMMGACAFLMPVAGLKFIRTRRYSLRTTVGMAIGGIFGSALALIVVKSLDLHIVMWMVTVVVIYTGISLLRTAAHEKSAADSAREMTSSGLSACQRVGLEVWLDRATIASDDVASGFEAFRRLASRRSRRARSGTGPPRARRV